MIARIRVDRALAATLNRPAPPVDEEERAAIEARVAAYGERLAGVGAGLGGPRSSIA